MRFALSSNFLSSDSGRYGVQLLADYTDSSTMRAVRLRGVWESDGSSAALYNNSTSSDVISSDTGNFDFVGMFASAAFD